MDKFHSGGVQRGGRYPHAATEPLQVASAAEELSTLFNLKYF